MVELGVYNENVRKLTCNDDSANKNLAPDNLVYTYGTRRKIPLTKILGDHGLHAPHYLNNGVEYIIKLPSNADVFVTQSSDAMGSYTLERLELEYETIENQELAETLIGEMYKTGVS